MSVHGEQLNPGDLAEFLDFEVPDWRTNQYWSVTYLHPITRQAYMVDGDPQSGYLQVDGHRVYSAAWLPGMTPHEVQNGC